ncbi:DUF7282 domain-containing protein [Salinimicrobium soli]|uniref:DUF7282 domain-containing protein n=1 Tax=Salinimicrobium soli TaxID=1254399 RepID=UPI003AAD0FCF
MKMKRNFLFAVLILAVVSFTACSDDDDSGKGPDLAPTGSLVVSDQLLENNTLTVSNVMMSDGGWVVVHRDNGSGQPVVPAIISVPEYVSAGETADVEITLADGVEVQNEETLWIMLHTDDGDQVYEFDGTSGVDAPIMDGNNIVMQSIVVETPPTGSLTVSDQVLVNNTVMVESVSLDRSGYVVIHADDNGAPMVPDIISEPVYLEAGDYTNVEVPLVASATVSANETLWVMLHTDTGIEEEYEFDGAGTPDQPIVVDGNVVVEPLTVTSVSVVDVSGSFTVVNQAVVDNTITVDEITVDDAAWVVVHADNNGAPVVPDIISNPVYLTAGTNTDVVITFSEDANVSAGDTVWIMLHDDSGAQGVYEFNGLNGLDLPLLSAGAVVVQSITLQ